MVITPSRTEVVKGAGISNILIKIAQVVLRVVSGAHKAVVANGESNGTIRTLGGRKENPNKNQA